MSRVLPCPDFIGLSTRIDNERGKHCSRWLPAIYTAGIYHEQTVRFMHPTLLEILACPACHQEAPLQAMAEVTQGDEITQGKLVCTKCAAEYPIRDGIPRFVQAEDNYCGNFGFQWQKWKELQIDRLGGHQLSETRFYADSRWERDWMKDKLILDAGCGAGRFTDIALIAGAKVVAMDLSEAIDACQETTRVHGKNGHYLQASLLDLPFKKGVFDAIYCMGVIQHTPDPKKVMTSLPALIKPGGRLAYNFYEEGIWRRLQVPKYLIRLITPHLPIGVTLALSKFLVASLFWFTSLLAPIRKIRILNHFIPIASTHLPELTREQQYTWTLLDTFDWYGARYEKCQRHEHVAEMLKSVNLENVESKPGLAWGTAPKDQAEAF